MFNIHMSFTAGLFWRGVNVGESKHLLEISPPEYIQVEWTDPKTNKKRIVRCSKPEEWNEAKQCWEPAMDNFGHPVVF